MEYPHNAITANTDNEDRQAFVFLRVQSEFFPVDEAVLTSVVQQWLLDNVPDVTSTTAQRREQVFPVTDLPPLP